MKLLALDTETTGLDLYHSAQPYLVTTCDGEGEQQTWVWEVDPLTRRVNFSEEEGIEIRALIDSADILVLQNAKFDIGMLDSVGVIPVEEWPWEKTHDTLVMAHVLASNRPKSLDALALRYLDLDITTHEKDLKRVCDEARRKARSRRPDWMIAKEGLTTMPSAKETVWKYDTWLPPQLADSLTDDGMEEYADPSHPWRTVTREYADCDSAVTAELYPVMMSQIRKAKLEKIYECRLGVVRHALEMERRGITVSKSRRDESYEKYGQESDDLHDVCIGIARSLDYDLVMPRSGNSKSLIEFVFDVLKLPALKVTDKGNKSLDKDTIDHWTEELPKTSKGYTFVKALKGKRVRDTARNYLQGYERFWLPRPDSNDIYLLHPFLNPVSTDTLRWSSSAPNSQNISKKEGFNLRYCFGPAPGRVWYSIDAKNLELRIPAYLSGESELIALFEKSEEPPFYGSQHLLNFSVVYPDIWGKELDEVGIEKVGPHCKKKYASTYYQWCKNGDFAIQYNCQRAKADATFRRDGSFDALKSRFSKLEALNQRCIAQANKYGYVEIAPDKGIDPDRGYRLSLSREGRGGVKPTLPLSYYVQGTAMWFTWRGQQKIEPILKQWREEGFDTYVTMQVHDELVIDMPDDETSDERAWLLKGLMESTGPDLGTGIPTPCGLEKHTVSWDKGETLA